MIDMSTKMPFDPITMWKSLYEQTEQNWGKLLQDLMEKEAFSEGMGDTLNHFLQYQQLVNKMTETYLKEVNIPSRSEVSNVASLIINLEEKIDRFIDQLDDQLAEQTNTNEIKQLKQSITNLEKKVSLMYEQIELKNKS